MLFKIVKNEIVERNIIEYKPNKLKESIQMNPQIILPKSQQSMSLFKISRIQTRNSKKK